jgi:GH25 family lysozyme M1 (1,4-beta-N-acetylmuramidase)
MTDSIIKGVDVSSWQGAAIAWPTVKGAGASFAFCKCSEGVGFKDLTFDVNWRGIQDAQLVRGAYHFARPDLSNAPIAEADWFLRCVGPLVPTDMLALDCEVDAYNLAGGLATWALAWLQHVEQAVGFPPLFYTSVSMANAQFTDSRLAHYPLWAAAYPPDPDDLSACPPRAGAWSSVAIWQHTDAAAYPGLSPVDESVVARTLDGLRALGKPAPGGDEARGGEAMRPVYRYARVTTDQWLRSQPDAASARLVEVTVGTVVPIVGSPTPHWVLVQAPGGQVGWLLQSNAHLLVDHP